MGKENLRIVPAMTTETGTDINTSCVDLPILPWIIQQAALIKSIYQSRTMREVECLSKNQSWYYTVGKCF